MYTALPLTVLAECFAKYPGIGMKTATRLAYQTLSMSEEQIGLFSNALMDVKTKIHNCTVCHNYTEQDVCSVCRSASIGKRDGGTICVVQSPTDVTAFERTGN